MKFFSMFSGIGGFDLALNQLNYQCVGYSEIDKYAIQIYEKNFGVELKNYGDATKIKPDELPDFDLLCGGFPCQAFSIAGKRRGFEDTRGTLFFEVARILKVKKPKLVLLENVKGLLNHDSGQTFKVIVETLEELGYDVQWLVLNSRFFGVAQNRERVFIVGSLRGQSRPEVLFELEEEQVINGSMEEAGESGVAQWRRTYFRFSSSGVSPTLTANMGMGGHNVPFVFKNGLVRKLTAVECERLQGFPDNWTTGVSDSQRYKLLGNAVTVKVIFNLIKKLKEKNEMN